jgi:hypothetical protein
MILKTKGQEEMVGFILIVVLVTVIALVFLGIFALKKPDIQSRQSDLLQSYISSITYYTTDCQDEQNRYQTISDLIGICQDNQICKNGKNACEVLDKTLEDIMNQSYIVSNYSFTRYYNLSILNGEGNEQRQLIQDIVAGNVEKCNGLRFFNDKTLPSSSRDKITIRVEICNVELD